MDLGLFTDSVAAMSFADALDTTVSIGATAVEIASGGLSSAPHLDLALLLRHRGERERWRDEVERRGLRIAAFNASGLLLHPVRGDADRRMLEATFELAGLLGVGRVVSMSGLPGDGPAASIPNWSFSTWPADAVAMRERQWDALIDLWRRLVARARREGVTQIALELHPYQLVYNVATLQRLRDEVGLEIGANVDPSHLIWQRMDPAAVVSELRDAVYHVHLKDTQFQRARVALNGVLDHTPEPLRRAWNFRAFGKGQGIRSWRRFIDALRRIGYEGALSIEHEDPFMAPLEGVATAARYAKSLLERGKATWTQAQVPDAPDRLDTP